MFYNAPWRNEPVAKSNEKSTGFLGTYFDRDDVLRIARIASVFAWIALAIYTVTTLVSFTQFIMQFATGLYYQKGMNIVDVINYFMPYFLQIIPGLAYFAVLKFVQHALLILLDIEDNTRRAARRE